MTRKGSGVRIPHGPRISGDSGSVLGAELGAYHRATEEPMTTTEPQTADVPDWLNLDAIVAPAFQVEARELTEELRQLAPIVRGLMDRIDVHKLIIEEHLKRNEVDGEVYF